MSFRAFCRKRFSGSRKATLLVFASMALAACASTAVPEVAIEEPLIRPSSPQTLAFAETAFNEGRFRDASAILERVLLGEPQNIQANLIMAEISLAVGDLRRAEAGFTQLAEIEDVRPRALQGKAIALLRDGRGSDARSDLQEAVADDPSLWRAWNALGFVHDAAHEWDLAEDAYGRAIELQPEVAILHNNRGYSRILQRRYDDAVVDLVNALTLDTQSQETQRNLRVALAWSGNYDQALAGAVPGSRAEVLNNVGYIALLKGDFDEAEGYLLRAIEADASFNQIAYRNLSLLESMRDTATK